MQIPRVNAAQRRVNNQMAQSGTQPRVNAAERRLGNQAAAPAPVQAPMQQAPQERINKEQRMTNAAFAAAGKSPVTGQPMPAQAPQQSQPPMMRTSPGVYRPATPANTAQTAFDNLFRQPPNPVQRPWGNALPTTKLPGFMPYGGGLDDAMRRALYGGR